MRRRIVEIADEARDDLIRLYDWIAFAASSAIALSPGNHLLKPSLLATTPAPLLILLILLILSLRNTNKESFLVATHLFGVIFALSGVQISKISND